MTVKRNATMGVIRISSATLAIGTLAVALAVPACGGDDKTVKYPSGTAADAGAGAGTVSTGSTNQDVGITGGPEGTGLTGAAKDAYDRGWKAWLAGDLPTAKAAFTEAGQKDTKSPAPHYSLGTVLERLGDDSGAQQEFRTAFSLKTDYEPAMCAYGLSLARAKHTGEADTFLTDKHGKMATSPRIATCLAEVKSIAGDSAGAQELARSALQMNPDYKDAMITIARDHYRAHRMDLAKYALQAILDGFGESSPPRDKDNAEAHLLRGVIEREQGARIAAMADFEAAKNKRPDLVEALIQTGAMKLEAGNVTEATPLLESAIRYAPVNALAHLNLGDCYRLGGRPTDAKREFDQALSLDSSLAVTHYDLGLMYLFSPSVPGMNADSQVATAIKELETYRSMRGAKAAPGQTDDVDELLSRAKQKQAELHPPTAAAPATPAKPAASAAPAKPASAAPKK